MVFHKWLIFLKCFSWRINFFVSVPKVCSSSLCRLLCKPHACKELLQLLYSTWFYLRYHMQPSLLCGSVWNSVVKLRPCCSQLDSPFTREVVSSQDRLLERGLCPTQPAFGHDARSLSSWWIHKCGLSSVYFVILVQSEQGRLQKYCLERKLSVLGSPLS